MKRWITSAFLLTLLTATGAGLKAEPDDAAEANRESLTKAKPERALLDERRQLRRQRILDSLDEESPTYWRHKSTKNVVGASIFGGLAFIAYATAGGAYSEANRYKKLVASTEKSSQVILFFMYSHCSPGSFCFYGMPNSKEIQKYKTEQSNYTQAGNGFAGLGTIFLIPTTIFIIRSVIFGNRSESLSAGKSAHSRLGTGSIHFTWKPRVRERGGDVSLTFLF